MGVCRSCWGNSKPQSTPKAERNARKRCRETSSLFQFMIPTCLWHNHEAKKTQTNPEKKQQLQHQLVKCTGKETTLREWILSSPVLDNNNNGNENVVKQISYNKIHPSLGEDNMDYGSNRRRSFSRQRLLKLNEINSSEVNDDVSSVSRSQSGKSKKRVSFRLPEEADIFVYSPPEEEDNMLLSSQRCELPLL